MRKFIRDVLIIVTISTIIAEGLIQLRLGRDKWGLELRTYENACLIFIVKDGRQAAHYAIDCADTVLFKR